MWYRINAATQLLDDPAPSVLLPDGTELRDNHTATSDGWHWHDTDEAAWAALSTPPTADPLTVLADIGTALGAITPTATSTALRAALLSVRTVIDTALDVT